MRDRFITLYPTVRSHIQCWHRRRRSLVCMFSSLLFSAHCSSSFRGKLCRDARIAFSLHQFYQYCSWVNIMLRFYTFMWNRWPLFFLLGLHLFHNYWFSFEYLKNSYWDIYFAVGYLLMLDRHLVEGKISWIMFFRALSTIFTRSAGRDPYFLKLDERWTYI